MRICLDPIKLLQEGKITPSECERIKGLPSNSPRGTCFLSAFFIVFGTRCIWSLAGLFAVFAPIVGLLILAVAHRDRVKSDETLEVKPLGTENTKMMRVFNISRLVNKGEITQEEFVRYLRTFK